MNEYGPVSFSRLLAALPAGYTQRTQSQIKEAFDFACRELKDREHPSGELSIQHNMAVAQIIAELGLDGPSVMAALLYESVDQNAPDKDTRLQNLFGSDVAALVLGLHHLQVYTAEDAYQSKTRNGDHENLESIRRAILTLTEGDIRLIMLRMANVLQDLRLAHKLPAAIQKELAREAMNVYAPLANRLGVWQLKWQLEDLAFLYLQPEIYKKISRQVEEQRRTRKQPIKRAINRLEKGIKQLDITATIQGRTKHIYSIFRKMERKNIPFEQIYDIQALRVIIDTSHIQTGPGRSHAQIISEERSLCYQVLGVIHNLWQPIPLEFDDYIASPKANGYRSLHTAVIDEHGHTLEVQIRTDKMDEEAERGIAAHWVYKEDGVRASTNASQKIKWYRKLLADLQDAQETLVDSDLWGKELLGERIYVVTPNGDVVDLPDNATPIDFAYHIHTEVGHRCRGAKVNGKMVSLDYHLKSGDKVEIITAARGGPSRDWMNEGLGYTASARSRNRIRQWFRRQERDQNIQYGRQVVERELKRLNLGDAIKLADIAEVLHVGDEDDFLAQVGFGDIQIKQIVGAIYKLQQKLKPDDELLPLLGPPAKATGRMTVQGMSGLHTKMAGCCHPIPPEPIVGYITRGAGITIHSKTCKTVEHIQEVERLIDLTWGEEQDRYPIPVVVRAYHRPGLIEEIANLLKGRKISVPSTKRTTANSITSLYMIVEVVDLDELQWLLTRLEKVPNVFEVGRQNWAA